MICTIIKIFPKKYLTTFCLLTVPFIFSGCNPQATHQNNHFNGFNSSQNNSNNTNTNSKQNFALSRFKRRNNLLSKEQKNIFWELHKLYNNRNILIFTKVSLGEIVFCDDKQTFLSIANCKRVDFLLVDRNFKPLIVIDYNKDKKTSEIKKEVLLSANIEYVEFKESDMNYLLSKINKSITPKLLDLKVY